MLIQLVSTVLALASRGASTPVRVSAVDTITVGHPALRGRTFRTGADTTDVFVERNGQMQLVNTSVDQVTATGGGMLVVFVGKGRGGESIDSVVVSPTTFAPIRHVEALPGKHATYTFGANRVVGQSTDSTGQHQIDEALRSGLFDFSVVQQVTGLLPLTAGYEAVVLAYDVAQMKERAVGYRVVGPERLTLEGRDVTAWKTVMDLGTHQVTRWVDASTRRDVKWDLSVGQMHMVGLRRR